MSFLFLGTVRFIAGCVTVYRQRYLRSDVYNDRFILLVLAFVASIIILIISPNIVRILLGWDGLGLVSYCLVIYYPTKKSRRAGIVTVIRNRVGDVCILLSIALFSILGEFNFMFWVLDINEFKRDLLLGLLIVVGAITKRAQVPFSAWLPAAMAAPTPVSALVHSSTLVTAGVYLLIRFSFLLSQDSLDLLLTLSVLTIFLSGLVASFEYDIKKIIALSTLRQLGVIMFSISLGLFEIAFFHLIIHALFKALLFLCAGVVIHRSGGSQDLRSLGSLINDHPLVGVTLNLANLSLCGVPFMSGFYSKDIVVEFAVQGNWNLFVVIILYLSLGLTVFYSLRLSFFTIVNTMMGTCRKSVCDLDQYLIIPIIMLTVASFLSGPCLIDLVFFPSLVFLRLKMKIITCVTIALVTLGGTVYMTRSKSLTIGWLSFVQGSM